MSANGAPAKTATAVPHVAEHQKQHPEDDAEGQRHHEATGNPARG